MPKSHYFQNPDLPGSDIYLPGNEIAILLFHGFTATTTEVRELSFFLSSKGFTIKAPLLPGHGTSYQDLNRKKFNNWTGCAEQAYIDLAKDHNTIIVGGESMGGVLSLYLAQKYKEIRALLLYSTALKIKNIRFAKMLSPFIDKINKKKSGDNMPWQGYTVYPLQALVEFNKLQNEVQKKLNLIEQPVLICQGKLDNTIDSDNADYIYTKISSIIKQVHFFENSSHVMIMDKEKEEIFNLTHQFLMSGGIL